jgi:hypothetical protein
MVAFNLRCYRIFRASSFRIVLLFAVASQVPTQHFLKLLAVLENGTAVDVRLPPAGGVFPIAAARVLIAFLLPDFASRCHPRLLAGVAPSNKVHAMADGTQSVFVFGCSGFERGGRHP